MFRVALTCDGIPAGEGSQAATDIQNEFTSSRGPRYTNATCVFEDGTLVLGCDNDGWDKDGLNLIDVFSDCLSAYVCTPFNGDLKLVSVTPL